MSLDIEAIKARAEAATEGPWRENKPLSSNGWVDVTSGVTSIAACYLSKADENAEFIAHAREDIPALITEVERLLAIVADVTALKNMWAEGLDNPSQLVLFDEVIADIRHALEG